MGKIKSFDSNSQDLELTDRCFRFLSVFDTYVNF